MKDKIKPLLLPATSSNLDETILLSLWLLCSNEPITKVAKRFGRTENECLDEFDEFCTAISTNIGQFIHWPRQGAEATETMNRFNEITAEDGLIFPNIFGIIHCMDVAQSIDRTSSLTDSQKPLTKVQCICDANGRFINCFVRINVRACSNADMFLSSPIHERLNDDKRFMAGRQLIVGDQTYPLTNYLIVPYKDRISHLSTGQVMFNRNIGRRRRIIDIAFRTVIDRFVRLSHMHSLPRLQRYLAVVFALNNCCTDEELSSTLVVPMHLSSADDDEIFTPRIVGSCAESTASNVSARRRVMHDDIYVTAETLQKRDDIMLRVQQQPQ